MPVGTVRQGSFAGGIWQNGARDEAPDNTASDLVNFLIGDDGLPYRRGGSVSKTVALGAIQLGFLWDGYLLPGLRTLAAGWVNNPNFWVLDVDDVTPLSLTTAGMLNQPVKGTSVGGLLFIDDSGGSGVAGVVYGGAKIANYATGTVTVTNGSKTVTGAGTAWTANAQQGQVLVIGGVSAVVQSVDSNTQITLSTPWAGTTSAGVAYALQRFGPAPKPGFYATVANRLLAASGSTLAFSAVLDPFKFASTDVHSFPDGVQLLGAAPLRTSAAVFTSDGVWSIDNIALSLFDTAGNPQQSKQLISRNIVLWHRAGIVEWEGGLIVPGRDGVWLMDGVTAPVRISDAITELYQSYVAAGCRPGLAAVYRDHLLMPILPASSGGSTPAADLLVCRLRGAAGGRPFAWTRFGGSGANVSALERRWAATGNGTDALIGATLEPAGALLTLPYLDPAAAVKADHDGTVHQATLETREIAPGDQHTSFRRLRVWLELTDAASDNPTITVGWRKDSDASYTTTTTGGVQGGGTTVGGTSDGSKYEWFSVEKRARGMRARIRQNNATSNFKIRAVEWVVEGSQVP